MMRSLSGAERIGWNGDVRCVFLKGKGEEEEERKRSAESPFKNKQSGYVLLCSNKRGNDAYLIRDKQLVCNCLYYYSG